MTLEDAEEIERRISTSLPETAQKEAWGDATFRVRDRIFAMIKSGDGRVSVWCKVPAGGQAHLVEADPDLFFVPPYVGPKGWVGMRLDGAFDAEELRRLVVRSYRLVAPRCLAARLEEVST